MRKIMNILLQRRPSYVIEENIGLLNKIERGAQGTCSMNQIDFSSRSSLPIIHSSNVKISQSPTPLLGQFRSRRFSKYNSCIRIGQCLTDGGTPKFSKSLLREQVGKVSTVELYMIGEGFEKTLNIQPYMMGGRLRKILNIKLYLIGGNLEMI